MRRELVGAGLATAVLMGGAFLGSAAVAQTAGAEASKASVEAAGPSKEHDAARERASAFAPQKVSSENGVTRVWGENRYQTAAAIAQTYGWDKSNTITVYIASGIDFPDALALGPSTMGDGPLLLVGTDKIPSDTAKLLKALQPCFIDVMGGTEAVTDKVATELQAYAHPDLCEGP